MMARGWRTPRRRRIGGACAPTKRSCDGCAVGQDRAPAAASDPATPRWASVDRHPLSVRRHPVGTEDRSPLAGLARGIPEPLDLLAAVGPLGRAGYLAPDLADVSGGARRRGATRLGRGLHRRQLLPGEKGGSQIGKTKRGKGSKCMVVVDGQGLPLGVLLASASPAEVTLVHPTLTTIAVPRNGPGHPRSKPDRLIADKAYDSEALRDDLARRHIELIAPHRRNRKRAPLQDGRKLRRYRRRWIVERTFAWYGSFRRLVVRYERSPNLYLAFFHLASALIVMRRL